MVWNVLVWNVGDIWSLLILWRHWSNVWASSSDSSTTSFDCTVLPEYCPPIGSGCWGGAFTISRFPFCGRCPVLEFGVVVALDRESEALTPPESKGRCRRRWSRTWFRRSEGSRFHNSWPIFHSWPRALIQASWTVDRAWGTLGARLWRALEGWSARSCETKCARLRAVIWAFVVRRAKRFRREEVISSQVRVFCSTVSIRSAVNPGTLKYVTKVVRLALSEYRVPSLASTYSGSSLST